MERVSISVKINVVAEVVELNGRQTEKYIKVYEKINKFI